MNKKLLKSIGFGLAAILAFLILSYGYMPEVLEGKIVNQSDISGYIGMSHEMSEWNKAHPDDPTYWTGSMFSGMPTTAISTQNGGDWTQPLYNLMLFGKRPASYLFLTLLGAFLLMLALGINPWLAVGGAVAIAFCSYNFQIIQVGHNTKMQALAFMPWVLAALVFTYRKAVVGGKRWLPYSVLGATLFALALNMQIKANHQQVTYYLAIMVLLYALVELIDIIARHKDRLVRFLVASGLLLTIGLVGIATNVNKLLPLYKYQEHTMRGGSELMREGPSGGLDIEYATAWSYGWEELPNLMIPNFNGGASAQAVDPDKSETVKLLRRAGQSGAREAAKALPMYWGPQPFTAGPMYMGAITVFLFILGLCLCKGKEKWWLLAGTVIAILMALGNHFMAFTKFCFAVLPLYNKFRTVSMALVVLQYSMPMLGFMALDRVLKGSDGRDEVRKGVFIAGGITAGFALLCALVPSLFGSFTAASDAGQPDILVDAFRADRMMLLRHDAWMAFCLILASSIAILWGSGAKNGRRDIAAAAICVLVAANMFTVGKRYLNSSHFTTPKEFSKPFAARTVDKIILEDPDPSYRVLDLTVNVFNSSVPSYRHKNVGGYSPAKLQRYQDLIDNYLTGEINSIYRSLRDVKTLSEASSALPETPILDALNCRYIILGPENAPLVNGSALGNAWFVGTCVSAATADEEIALIGGVNLEETAVIRSEDLPSGFNPEAAGSIEMVGYTPNELRYEYKASAPALAVFSEVWYPGWTARLEDGTPVELIKADWILRSAVLPEGEHTLTMRFEPSSYRIGARISRASSAALILCLLLSLYGLVKVGRKGDEGDAVGA